MKVPHMSFDDASDRYDALLPVLITAMMPQGTFVICLLKKVPCAVLLADGPPAHLCC